MLSVVVNLFVLLYTLPTLVELNSGRAANATEPEGLYTEETAALILLSVSVFVYTSVEFAFSATVVCKVLTSDVIVAICCVC